MRLTDVADMEQIGRSVITREKASDYLPPADRIQELPETEDNE